ncbi:MAG TPA: antibiotic biosynthesis monooxygenase [Clostridia bacterium]|nr:antibiotic biosynthesis monooxygenase [Clostridia bacterium]
MVTVIAKLTAAAGKEKELAALCKNMAAQVRENEPGCLEYAPFVSLDASSVFLFYEKYQDNAAFDAHVKTPYFKQFMTDVTPLLAADMEVQRFEE